MDLSNEHSIDALIQLLENARKEQSLKFNTARTRITALRKLKSYLNHDEQQDFEKIDKEALAEKLRTQKQNPVNEGTIQTYLTRLDKSIEFYKNNLRVKNTEVTIKPIQPTPQYTKETLAISIDGILVRISNLPMELSEEQAEKICMIVKEYARERKI